MSDQIAQRVRRRDTMADDDDDDPFDALMGIDAEEFKQLLDEAPASAAAGEKVFRGGVAVVDDGSISREEFRARFLVPRVPVVIRDAAFAPTHLTPAYLRATYGDVIVPLDVTAANRADAKLGDFLDALSSTSSSNAAAAADDDDAERSRLKSRYLRNLQMHEWFPREAAKLRLPERLFGANALADAALVPRCPDSWRRWHELFVCGPECDGFPFLHRDTCGVAAASMQAHGAKRFTLFHPDDGARLYPRGGSGLRSEIPARALAKPGGVCLETYPAFARAKRITVDVRAGECLVVPPDWWHTARAVGDEVSVSVAASFVDVERADAFNDAYAEFEALRSLASVGAAT